MTATKKNNRNPVQLLISETTSAMARNEFLTNMCFALVATNIPFNKLQSTPFKNFLKKYVNQNIPDESKLQKKLTNDFIYIMVDKMTDSIGLYICSLIVRILHPEIMPTSFLISYKEFKKTKYETFHDL
jgi:hypothetical protein